MSLSLDNLKSNFIRGLIIRFTSSKEVIVFLKQLFLSDEFTLGQKRCYDMFSWYKYLIVSLVFSHLGFWSGNIF